MNKKGQDKGGPGVGPVPEVSSAHLALAMQCRAAIQDLAAEERVILGQFLSSSEVVRALGIMMAMDDAEAREGLAAELLGGKA